MTMQNDSWNGKSLREMFRTGTTLLGNNSAAVNALNVFPVPDGDTGTNMLLTMQAAMEEANLCNDHDASVVAAAMSQGALMGARGNSGVILSQILRGLAGALKDKNQFTALDMMDGLLQASVMADRAVSQPVEGTMLTVMREAASAAQTFSAGNHCSLQGVVQAVVKEARESVNRTPGLLPVLQKAGVVDAGGEGLRLIMEGMLCYLEGTEIEAVELSEFQQGAEIPQFAEEQYGYCTEFLVQGSALDLLAMRAKLCEIGEHVLVVGDENTARIHVHTFEPETVLEFGNSLGELSKIKIDDMQEQHREFIAGAVDEIPQSRGNISIVAVVTGEGMAEVYRSLGVTNIIDGGETMNPSVQDLFEAVKAVPAGEVIILPNNGDVLPAADQVCKLASKKVAVVPSRSMTQGIAALLSFNFLDNLSVNLTAMEEGLSGVCTGGIATAVRTMQYKDVQVKEGQVVGFFDEKLTVAQDTIQDTLNDLLSNMEVEDSEILTLYYGDGIDLANAQKLSDFVRSKYSELEVEVVFGGQPHYHYLISLE